MMNKYEEKFVERCITLNEMEPVTNLWALLFGVYIALTFWINLFPEYSWDFLKYGF